MSDTINSVPYLVKPGSGSKTINSVPYLVKGLGGTTEGYFYEGKFYEDAQHTKEIEPIKGQLYFDNDTNRMYIYNGTDFLPISGGGAGFRVEVVDTLPETGENGVLYLVPNSGAGENIYDEYVWIESGERYEKIGTTEIDLSQYYTKSEINAKVLPTFGDSETDWMSQKAVTENFVRKDENVYASIAKVAPYSYETDYDTLDYDYALEYFEHENPDVNVGACSSFIAGSGEYTKLARNYDWKYDESANFVVHTSGADGLFATVGVAGSIPGLTQELVDSGAKSDLYRLVPFFLQDGMNEYGLCVSTNVIAAEWGDNSRVEPKDMFGEPVEISMPMFPRYILDHCSKIYQVEELVTYSLILTEPQSLIDMGYDQQFIVTDSDGECLIINFEDGRAVITDGNDIPVKAMTNFAHLNLRYNRDGTVYTPADIAGGHYPSGSKVTPYGQGLERYNLIAGAGLKYLTEVNQIKNLLASLKYTKSYSTSPDVANPFWYTEFVGDDVTTDSTPAEFAEVVAAAGQEFATRTRDGATWHTVHSAIYDPIAFKLHVAHQESGVYKEYGIKSSMKDLCIIPYSAWYLDSTSADEIEAAYGGLDNLMAIKDAIENKKTIAGWEEKWSDTYSTNLQLNYAIGTRVTEENWGDSIRQYYIRFVSGSMYDNESSVGSDPIDHVISLTWSNDYEQFISAHYVDNRYTVQSSLVQSEDGASYVDYTAMSAKATKTALDSRMVGDFKLPSSFNTLKQVMTSDGDMYEGGALGFAWLKKGKGTYSCSVTPKGGASITSEFALNNNNALGYGYFESPFTTQNDHLIIVATYYGYPESRDSIIVSLYNESSDNQLLAGIDRDGHPFVENTGTAARNVLSNVTLTSGEYSFNVFNGAYNGEVEIRRFPSDEYIGALSIAPVSGVSLVGLSNDMVNFNKNFSNGNILLKYCYCANQNGYPPYIANWQGVEVESGPTGGGIKVLTEADYNWPLDNPNKVALWLLDSGVYEAPSGIHIAPSMTSYPWYESSDRTLVIGGTSLYAGIYTFLNGNVFAINTQKSDGSETANYTLLKSDQVTNSLTSTSTTNPLSANQGKVLKDLIDSLVIKGTGAPTSSTAGTVGKLYEDTTNGALYQCTSASGGVYTWVKVGGSDINVVQTTGQSTTDVMSQKAVTDLIGDIETRLANF